MRGYAVATAALVAVLLLIAFLSSFVPALVRGALGL